jgi:hypothetical protein
MPMGLELSLSDMQAIIRNDHSEEAYQTRLSKLVGEGFDVAPDCLPVAPEQFYE